MAKPISIPNTFASATTAIPLAQLDQDFSTLANATNDLATYSNYVADTGVADAYIANFPANTNTSSLTAGLTVQFKAANANTGASTLNVQVNGASIGTAAIRYANGSALAAGAIAAGAMVSVMYDGTNFQLINDPAGQSGGDVTGPASATDNAIARFDGATGKLIQNSVVTIADTTGDMAGVGNISATNVTVTSLNNSGNLTFTGTGNRITGDFSNATDANRVALQTSTTNNGTRVNIISNGTGTASSLDVFGVSDPTNAAVMRIRQSSVESQIQATITGTGTYLPLTMFTGGSERLRIDTSGNVGIGTTPNYRLEVAATAPTNSIIAYLANSQAASSRARIAFQDASTTFAPNLGGVGNNITFDTVGSERMRIDSSGNVGIGTSSPTSASGYTSLCVNNATNGGFIDLMKNGTAYLRAEIDGSNNALIGTGSGTTTALRLQTNNTERMRITSGGNVGINTSSPSVTLDVNGTVNTGQINTGNGISTGDANIELGGLRTGSGPSYIDFHSVASTDYETRIIRSTGANGAFQIINTGTGDFALTGIGSAPMIFTTSNAERMRIDSSGNVSIGSTNTSGKLTVTSTTNAIYADLSNGTIQLREAGNLSANNTVELHVRPSAGKSGYISFTENAVADRWSIGIQNGVDALRFMNGSPTGGTERMRITSGGDVLFGTTNSSAEASVGFKFQASSTVPQFAVVVNQSGTNACISAYNANAGAYRFYVTNAGTIFATSTTISAISDQRLKENVRDLDFGLDTIMAVKPRRFDWKQGKGADKKDDIGFIAQEFETVFPNSVATSLAGADGIEYKSVNHSELIPTLVKAIQEMKAIIDEQAARISALESK